LIGTVNPPVTRTTTYAYDFRDRLLTTTLPDPDHNPGTNNTPKYETRYDNLGRPVIKTDGTGDLITLGHYMTYAYDDINRTTTVIGFDPDGSNSTTNDVPVTVTAHNARGLLSTETDPMGRVTSYLYDGAGRETRVTQPDPATGTITSNSPHTDYG